MLCCGFPDRNKRTCREVCHCGSILSEVEGCDEAIPSLDLIALQTMP